MAAVAITHKAEILERVAQGHRLTDIAQSLGVTQPALSKQLAHDPDYTEARESGLQARMEQWEGELETIGPDSPQVMLARARELLSHARWRAEREAPHRWGQRNQSHVDVRVGVSDRLSNDLSALLGRVIEQQRLSSHTTDDGGDGV